MTKLTRTQYGIYLECVSNPGKTTYNIPFLQTLPAQTDVSQIVNAIEKMIAAHPILSCRTVADEQGEIGLEVQENCCVKVEKLSDEAFEALRSSVVRPFVMGEELARFEVYCTPSQVYYFEDIHHLINDGNSAGIMGQDRNRAYAGEEVLPETYTYAEESLDEEQRMNSEELKQAKAFYENLLDGYDTDCAPVPDSEEEEELQGWKTYPIALDKNVLKACRKEWQISNSAFFTTVLGFVIARFNAVKSSVISTIYSGRSSEKYARTVSMLVKTMPFLTDIEKHPVIKDLLQANQAQLDGCRANTLYSYVDLAADLGLHNDINFAYQGHVLDYQTLAFPGASIERIYDPAHVEETKLLMELSELADGSFQLHVGFRKDSYTEEFVDSLVHAYQKAAQGFLTAEKVDEIGLSDEAELERLDSFNQTDRDYDTSLTVVDHFRKAAQAYPDHTAVVFKDVRLSYRQLDEMTDLLALRLHAMGIGREKVAAVLIPRCEYMVVASLAVMKAGGAYLPLDPSYPPERLNLMVEDSGAMLMITTPELSPIITESFTGPRLLIQEIEEECREKAGSLTEEEKKEVLTFAPKSEDLYIMLYTSGSTGVPKGVMLEQRNLAAFRAWIIRDYGMNADSRSAAYASYGFDANMMDTYPILSVGGTLYIIPEEMRLNLVELHAYFIDSKITHSFMTTQIGRQFATIGDLPDLKVLGLGGEKLASMAPPKFRFVNVYGPTECTILTTFFNVDRLYKDIPIGKPLDNFRLYVVDESGKRLPVGAAGELWISGPQVSRGYLNRPEKTAEAYISNPFETEEKYARVYRSGDIVRYLPDGNIQFIGRRDAQIKVRGFRIELTEIEEVIRRFPGIIDATTKAFDDPAGGKYVAAYVVAPEGETVDIDAMNAFIAAEKPPYMVPAVTMQIDAIPYNQNQKVNKKVLPTPERKAENITPPENEMQQKIFDILAKLLGHTDFGVDSDIYLSGLTSIGSVQLNVLLSKAFDQPFTTQDLKENNTIRKLEAFINGSEAQEKWEIQAQYPLTQTQMGILTECLVHPGSTIYNIPILFELDPSIELKALKKAAVVAINAHPYVLTRLGKDEKGNVVQLRDTEAVMTEEEIEEISVEQIDTIQGSLVEAYELLGGRLFRMKVIQTAEKKFLFVDMHHIISDGTSLNILLEDISRAYLGQEVETEIYSGYEAALTEQKRLAGPDLEKAKAVYEEMLSGAETDCAPQRVVHSPEESSALYTYTSALSVEELKAFCSKQGISMSTLMNAAFGFTLGKYTYKEDVTYCTVYNGRSDSRMERMMSMLVKTFPVRCTWDKDTKSADYLSSVGDRMVSAMASDLYSFAQISHDHHINADILFTYQGDSFAFDHLGGKPCRQVLLELDEAKADLDIDAVIRDGKLELECSYRSDLYDENFLKTLAECVCNAAEKLTREEKLSQIGIASPEMIQEVESMNQTDFPVAEESVNCMFEREVEKHPEQLAIKAAGETLTYQELNILANKVAHGLIARGVHKDEVVGLISDRSKAVYIGELGILKAGSAFLPMVPEYPDDRIDFCLTDAASRYVLTTQAIAEDRTELFTGKPYQVLTIEELLSEAGDNAGENPNVCIDSDALAYVIYTSGSTGTPKGVMIEHHNLRNFLDPNEKNPETAHYVQYGHVILSVISVSFDFSLMETMLPLSNGLTICMASEEQIHDPLGLAQLMKENQVDVMACTPSFLGNMVDVPQIAEALGNMKLYDFGAEAFPSSLYDRLTKASPNAVICNGYGPTETTISCISKVLDAGENITIGKPAANVQALVCDQYMHRLPVGASGELLIGGLGVGRGYVNLPEKTAAVFVELDGKRVYRSGDLVRLLPNGEIEFFGRLDNQVKLRGFRVELDEIENQIVAFPGVKNSKVVVRNNGSEDYLAGFFTAEAPVDLSELTAHLKEKLTYYMVPSVLMQLDEMPLTVNGKIDKKRLPEVGYTMEREYVAPEEGLETTICQIFQEILHMDKVGATESFFEIGGTSLTATNVVLRLSALSYSVVYKNIFDYPTARELAAFLEGGAAKPKKTKDFSDIENYDYSAINALLAKNTVENVDSIRPIQLGNIILTGAVGFLGIHILKEFLDHEEGIAYCLIRKGRYESLRKRMQNMLMYYFGDPMEEVFDKRIVPVEGDITDQEQVDQLMALPADVVINCAACVKHFVKDDLLDRVNTEGVKKLISMCSRSGKRLIQISTTSVGGMMKASQGEHVIKENELYFGQQLDNDYIRTKFLAERALLEAVAKGQLKGQVIRVGNLMSRSYDGEFQINFISNGYMRSLKGYKQLGAFPMSAMYAPAEFSPIDSTAASILKLAASESEFTVFHAFNSHLIYMSDVIYAMRKYGFKIDIVSDEKFASVIKEASSDERMRDAVLGIIAYDSDDADALTLVDAANRFTTESLYRLDYLWPITDNKYLYNCISVLDGFEYFDFE